MSVAGRDLLPETGHKFECIFEVRDEGRLEHRRVLVPDLTKYPAPYKPNTTIRVAALALLVVTATLGILALSGHLATFPHGILKLVHGYEPYVLLGGGISLMLEGGALIVFQRVLKKRDLFSNTPLIEMSGSDHWKRGMMLHLNSRKEIVVSRLSHMPNYFFSIDTSSLRNGNSRANGYAPYAPLHEVVGGVLAMAAPFYMVAAMAYNVGRTVAIPFYILGCMCTEQAQQYKLSDIPKEMALSIARAVKAPFYATAFCFAAIRTIVNPQEGSKLLGAIERDWNEDVSLSDGMWLCDLKSSWFSRWNREDLGKNGLYLAKCKQPTCVIECDRFEEGAEVIVHSRSHALDPSRGYALRGKVINGCLVVLARRSAYHPNATLDFAETQ
ncbi:MAG: hypothetical protein WAM28_04460 [Chlamydiales bacterium]